MAGELKRSCWSDLSSRVCLVNCAIGFLLVEHSDPEFMKDILDEFYSRNKMRKLWQRCNVIR